MTMHYGVSSCLSLSSTVDDFGNEVTLHSWNSIIARMDFLIMDEE